MSADTVSADAVHVEVKKQRTFDKELLKSYRRLREDYLWVFANEGTLRATYSDKYIAVENKSVKFSNESMEGVLAQINQSGEQVEDFVIEYMGKRRLNLLFQDAKSVRVFADLDANRHAHVFGLISCSQFNRPKPIHLVVDTGSTNTTLLSNDVARLGINCNNLRFASVPCLTANGIITPYLLPHVELSLARRYGWFNRNFGLVTFEMANIHCMPPTHPQFLNQQRLLQSYSLLGMDVLSFFRRWYYAPNKLILDT